MPDSADASSSPADLPLPSSPLCSRRVFHGLVPPLSIFLLLSTSPSTVQILRLLPIVTTTSLGISQRSSIPLTPGQTYAEFQANHDLYRPPGTTSLAKPRQEKASVEYVVTFRKEGVEGEKVEVGVKEIGEVEGLLREVKRLKAVKEEWEKGPGRWRRGGKGHGW